MAPMPYKRFFGFSIEKGQALQKEQIKRLEEAGCDAVRVEAEVTLSHLERMFMRDVAEENRAKGISMANDICKNYRREGMFFDEILDEAKAGGN